MCGGNYYSLEVREGGWEVFGSLVWGFVIIFA